MDRENALYKAAYRAAESHYKDFLANSRRSERENAQGKQMGKEEIVQMLTDKFYDKLDKMYPELSTKQEAALLKAEPAKVAKALTFDKDPVADKKIEFSAYKDLIEPKQGDKDWYGLNKDQMKYKMQELGYDTSNKLDIEKFYKRLQEHQQNYDRGQIVNDELNSPAGVAASMLAPSATEEAVKQSLAGEYDDDRMNRAVAIDAVANGMMAAGPMSRVLGGTPLRAGLNAAGAEAGRQTMNMIEDRSFNPSAILMSGAASATAPAAGLYIGGLVAKGASAEAKPAARGFLRGLRNIDPVEQEKAMLKDELVRTRYNVEEAIKQAQKRSRSYRKSGPKEMAYNENQMAMADLYDKASDKLTVLGFEKESSPMIGTPGTPKYSIEEVLGKPPVMINGKLVYKSPHKYALESALKEYDKPVEYRGLTSTGSNIPELATIEQNAGYRAGFRESFPAKLEQEKGAANAAAKREYDRWLNAGRIVGAAGTQVEPIIKVNPFNALSNIVDESVENKNMSKAEKYKNTEWYKSFAEKNPQKAYALEKALGGAR